MYDGELGDMPVILVIPDDPDPKTLGPQIGTKDADLARTVNFLERARQRCLATSSRSELIHVTIGTSRNFPYEVQGFVVETVRGVLAKSHSAR